MQINRIRNVHKPPGICHGGSAFPIPKHMGGLCGKWCTILADKKTTEVCLPFEIRQGSREAVFCSFKTRTYESRANRIKCWKRNQNKKPKFMSPPLPAPGKFKPVRPGEAEPRGSPTVRRHSQDNPRNREPRDGRRSGDTSRTTQGTGNHKTPTIEERTR